MAQDASQDPAGRSRVAKQKNKQITNEPIAIIGMGCRFPGGADDLDSFWNLLLQGIDAISEVPHSRWSNDQFFHPDPKAYGTTYSKWGGFLEDIDQFDPAAFGISPREAISMDPQQRLMLEVTKQAIDDAGLPSRFLRGTDTSVCAGVSTMDYSLLQSEFHCVPDFDAYSGTGTATSIVANRVSYCFDLHGPSVSVDTACSSSLLALHQACETIWTGQSQMAIAGGVNACLSPINFIAFSKLGVLSPDGRCKAFDASANGFVRSEGAGAVILKPFRQAVADGDRIYALVQASGVNQDGLTNGLAVPNGKAQQELIQETFRKAGLEPSHVAYVEAHGTGTAVGDPTEVDALGRVLGVQRNGTPCHIGSVKTNVGHLEAAAGIAGVIKAALVAYHKMMPRNLHFHTPNPNIDFQSLGVEVVIDNTPLQEQGDAPTLIAVNSFGFGGTNVHTVLSTPPKTRGLKESPAPKQATDLCDPSREAVPRLIKISAMTPQRLQRIAGSWCDFLPNTKTLGDVGAAAALRRDDLDHRLCVVANNGPQAALRIRSWLEDEKTIGIASGNVTRGEDAQQIGFVFSGQGPQWWAMGRELLESSTHFLAKMTECDELIREFTDWSLLDELRANELNSRIGQTAIAQPALCALQIALARWWMQRGIRPTATVGHSVGELAAAHVAGRLTLRETMRIVIHRGRCIQNFAKRGQMLAAPISPEEAADWIDRVGADRVGIAAKNSDFNVTFSGTDEAITELDEQLAAAGIQGRILQVDFAFHSPLMNDAGDPFLSALGQKLSTGGTETTWISSVTGRPCVDQIGAQYWWDNVRQPVDFVGSMNAMLESGVRTVVEISPHPVLFPSITEILKHRGHESRVAISLRRGEPETTSLLTELGRLYCWGHQIDWQTLYPDPYETVSLPGFPWDRNSFWNQTPDAKQYWLTDRTHPIMGSRAGLHQTLWRNRIDPCRLPFLNDHRFQDRALLPATAYIDMALAAARELLDTQTPSLESMQLLKTLFLPEEPQVADFISEYDRENREMRFHGRVGQSSWALHTRTIIGNSPYPLDPPIFQPDEIIDRCSEKLPGAIVYELTAGTQLWYGNAFRGIKEFWRSEAEVLATVELPDVISTDEKGYLFHPAFLDACIQTGNLNWAEERWSNKPPLATFVPVSVDQVHFFQTPKTKDVWVHAVKVRETPKSQKGDYWIYDSQGQPLIALLGFESSGIPNRSTGDGSTIDDWIYQVAYLPVERDAPDHQQSSSQTTAVPLEHLKKIASETTQRIDDLVSGIGAVNRYLEPYEDLTRAADAYIHHAFQTLGLFRNADKWLGLDEVITACRIDPLHRSYVQFAMNRLAAMGRIELLEDSVRVKGGKARSAGEPDRVSSPDEILSRIIKRTPMSFPEAMMLHVVGNALPEVLTGKSNFQSVLFGPGKETLMEHFYQDSAGMLTSNIAVAEAVSLLASSSTSQLPFRILEVGGGTGGVTSHLLPRLEGHDAEYVFTDLSPAFLTAARRRYPEYPFVQYQRLDLEQPATEQGLEENASDLVVAVNVLHAIDQLDLALQEIKKVLKPGGVLCMMEVINSPIWIHAIFGLTQQWWNHLSEREEVRARSGWRRLLENHFQDVVEIEKGISTAVGESEAQNVILLARKSSQAATRGSLTGSENRTGEKAIPPKRYLLLADTQGFGSAVATQLESVGEHCVVLSENEPIVDIESALCVAAEQGEPFDCVLHFRALDCLANDDLACERLTEDAGKTWGSLQVIFRGLTHLQPEDRPSVIAATIGSMPIDDEIGHNALNQSAVQGVLAVAACEYPSVKIRRIDMDPSLPLQNQVDEFVQEAVSNCTAEECGYRRGQRYEPRLQHGDVTRPDGNPIRPRDDSEAKENFRLPVPRGGTIDQVRYQRVPDNEPEGHQVEVEVIAAGLNFRDVLKVLGRYPMDGDYLSLGDECAGVVRRVGPAVTDFAPGDEVLCAGSHCFSKRVVTSEHLVMRKPNFLTFEDAATIPIAFLTAHYCLHHVARLKRGERVLIHAAAGGVGIAAIQLAQQVGAEIYATASKNKQDLVRLLGVDHVFDSRTLEFGPRITAATSGRGVDVILNSLAGDAMDVSLKTLARYGRFVEIGKRDLYENRRLALGYFQQGISFHSVDLSRVMTDDPALIRQMMQKVGEGFETRKLKPLPYRVFQAERIRDAQRIMAEGKHVGKLVVSFRNANPLVDPPEPDLSKFRSDATYVLTGGSGALATELARGMLVGGARNLVLVGRRDAESESALSALKRLEGFNDAKTVFMQADVSCAESVQCLFDRIDRELPPVRGVAHLAGVLDDGPLVTLSNESFLRTMMPKVLGAWNLHESTKDKTLDFFLLISSTASMVGNPGQANYAAANAFLDNFVFYRRQLGLPATVINFGPLADVGMAASDPDVVNRMDRLGVSMMPIGKAIDVVRGSIWKDQARTGAARVKWNRWLDTIGFKNVPVKLLDVYQEEASDGEGGDNAHRIRQRLTMGQAEQRIETMLNYVASAVARVLGTSVENLDPELPLHHAGLDSLTTIELSNRLENELQISIPVDVLAKQPSLSDFSNQLLDLVFRE